jgi:hypothetical protein
MANEIYGNLGPIKPRHMIRDQEIDFDWIMENVNILRDEAAEQFRRHGRGALVMDSGPRGQHPPISYMPLVAIPEDDPEAARRVREYSPANGEFVIVVIKGKVVNIHWIKARLQQPDSASVN